MKSKKLFAILTLVAFMMTLVPAMAFGEDPVPEAANRYASSAVVDSTTVDATGEDFAEIIVYLFDAGNNKAVDQKVYIASSRGNSEKFYEENETDLLTEVKVGEVGTKVFESAMSSSGKVEINVASLIAGTATFAIGLEAPTTADGELYKYLMGISTDTITADTVRLVAFKDADGAKAGTKKVTFVASGVDEIIQDEVKDKNGDPNVDNMQSNGSDYYEIAFQVQNKANAGVSGEDVKFSVNKSGARLNKTTATTDAQGIVKVKVYSDKADEFLVKATCGKESKEVKVTFGAGTSFNITLVDDNNQKIALAQKNKEFEVKIADLRDNETIFENATEFKADMENIEVVTEPTGSDIKGKCSYDLNDDGDPVIEITEFKKEGDYVVRAALKNGKYVDIKFTVKEQGDIVALSLEYDEKSLMLNSESSTPTVKQLDADGISLDVSTGLEFFSSDLDKATVDVDGVVKATDESDYLGDVTISVVDTNEKKTASAVITICDYARALVFEAPKATVPGETAKVTVKAVDKKGNVVALGSDVKSIETAAWVISAPAGSSNSADFDSDFEKDLKQKGAGVLEVDCDKDGTVKVQVKAAVKYTGDTGNFALSGIVEVPFSKNAAPIDAVGANSLTMFIGNTAYVQDGVAKVTDVAPFIKDSRTFVAIRPVADAFGCEIGWNEATQTVTLTRTDITVTIVIGSKDITVTRNGVVETVTADVAAFIQNGRTVLPFRAIGNIFGATVNYDATTQSVSYAQQAQK